MAATDEEIQAKEEPVQPVAEEAKA